MSTGPFGAILCAVTILTIAAGKYEGSYTSDGAGGGGALRVALTQKEEVWASEVSFDYDGSSVPCKVVKVEVTGEQVLVAYRFNLGGYELESTLNGSSDGDSFNGTYQTKALDGQGVDRGTFKLKRK